MKIDNLKFIFIILAFFFSIKKCYCFEYEKYSVKNIFVEFYLSKDKPNRKKAIDLAYEIALKRYLTWITLLSKEELQEVIKKININKVIMGYSIENEKFKENKYNALITVNFDKSKISQTLTENNIKFSMLKGPKTLIIPIIQIEDRQVLWDDPNPWFEAWMQRPLDANLTEFILPVGDVEDLILLSAEDAQLLNYFKIRNISNKYEVKKTIILFLTVTKKQYDFTLNLKAFDGLTSKEISIENFKYNNKDSFNLTLLNLANSFANYFDDLLVEKDMKEIGLSKTNLNLEIYFESLEQWVNIKEFLMSYKNSSNFNVLKISNTNALVSIKMLAREQFIEYLMKKEVSYEERDNIWIINLNRNIVK